MTTAMPGSRCSASTSSPRRTRSRPSRSGSPRATSSAPTEASSRTPPSTRVRLSESRERPSRRRAPSPAEAGSPAPRAPSPPNGPPQAPALAKMREYYGTAKREESPPPETGRPREEGPSATAAEAQHAFAGGAQVAKKIARTASHGNLDNHPDAAEPVASSSADRSTHEGGGSKYGSLSGGPMPATAFQGRAARSCPLRNPRRVRPPRRRRTRGGGFFDALKGRSRAKERRSSPARRPDSDSRRGALEAFVDPRAEVWVWVSVGARRRASRRGARGKAIDMGGVCSHSRTFEGETDD